MSFRLAVLEAVASDPKLSRKFTRALSNAAEDSAFDGRMFWSMAERVVTRRYRRATGKVGKIDWQKALDWLVENLPAILKILLSLLVLI